MHAKQEKEFYLLQSDIGVYGLYLYATGRNISKEQKRQYNLVVNFKTKGINRDMFKTRIEAVANYFGCKQIAVMPGSGKTHNTLQELFGADRIKRIKAVQELSIDDNTLMSDQFQFNDSGEKTLIVGYISKTGNDLKFFAKHFRNPVLFSIGLHSGMNPRVYQKVKLEKPKEPSQKDQEKAIGNVSDRVAFIASLKNGFGFTKACQMILAHPKEMTKKIMGDPEFYKECENALKFSAKALLVMSNTHLEKKQFSKWVSNNEYIKQFKSELVLWESFRKRSHVTNRDVIIGFKIYRDIAELATAIGFTESELVQYISDNRDLSVYFSDMKVI